MQLTLYLLCSSLHESSAGKLSDMSSSNLIVGKLISFSISSLCLQHKVWDKSSRREVHLKSQFHPNIKFTVELCFAQQMSKGGKFLKQNCGAK